MIVRLDEIEVGLVGVVVVGHIRVGDGDAGVDLLVEQLFLGEAAANVALQLVEGEVRGLELGLELLLGVGSLHLGELGLDLGVGCGQALLGGALLDDGFEDKRMDDVEPQRVSLIRRRRLLLRVAGQLRRVGFVHVGLEDGVTVDGGDDALLRAFVAAGDEDERGREKNTDRTKRLRHRGGFLKLWSKGHSYISLQLTEFYGADAGNRVDLAQGGQGLLELGGGGGGAVGLGDIELDDGKGVSFGTRVRSLAGLARSAWRGRGRSWRC